MSLKNKLADNFTFGLLTGTVLLFVFYFVVNGIRMIFIDKMNDPYLLKPPFAQLICLAMNMIVFRIVMINMEKEKTGKGILFITVITAFVYFVVYYKMSRTA